jgi:site-specific recombinase XerD
MSTINFYLKKADKKGESPVLLSYLNRGDKFRYSTKLKVRPEVWKNQRVKTNYTGYSEINSILDDLENILRQIEREALFNKKEYTIDIIKRKFQIKLGNLTHENDFFSVYDRFIDDSRAIKSKATIQTYVATKVKLKDFIAFKGCPISFDIIDQFFYEAFLSYMIEDLGHLNNTVGKHIKTLKVFLRYAIEHEYTNQNYNFRKFKVFSEDADIIYLTEAELLKIYNLQNLPEILIPVRDNFCFACFTGLRFSDIDKLRHTHIKTDYVEIRAEKTKDFLKVPLNDFSKAILSKYQNKLKEKPLPTGLSNQKSNFYLKELGKIAQIQEIISIEKFNGSKKKIITKPKFDFLCTHTARRTFVTLALEKGIRAEVVMAMTGHRSYKTFKKYIKITDKVMQAEMQKVWHLPLLKVV